MAKVNFKRVQSIGDLSNLDIVDGNLIVTGDGNLFIDYNGQRIAVGGTPDIEMSDTSINPVQNKVIKEYVDDLGDDVSNLIEKVDNIESGITGSTIPITWDNAISEISNTENSIKINTTEKSCLLTFAVNRTSAIDSAFVIGTFDITYAPTQLVIGTGVVSSTGIVSACQLSIDSSGNININNRGHSSNTFRGQIKWYY